MHTFFLFKIFTATFWPVSSCTASLTLQKLPIPSVRPEQTRQKWKAITDQFPDLGVCAIVTNINIIV